MEGLGREFNVVPIASGVAIALKDCDGVTFVGSAAATFSLTIATSFGGTYRAGSFFTPAWVPLDHYYQAAATNGTAQYTRVAQTAADNVVQAGAFTTVLFLSQDSLPDGYTYVKCTASAGGLVAITHDLDVQRKPQNLAAVSA